MAQRTFLASTAASGNYKRGRFNDRIAGYVDASGNKKFVIRQLWQKVLCKVDEKFDFAVFSGYVFLFITIAIDIVD